MRKLNRLLRPRSIAVVGGGAWCASVIEQCRKAGFKGDLWPVHSKAKKVQGLRAFKEISSLPAVPDACFIGVNRHATIEITAALAKHGAGGAVCFASGFMEAEAEDAEGTALQQALLSAAGDMPILGPNCYGFINYLDGALLWPDQHGGQRVEKGVAIVTQSSNIAINLTMQARGLPIAYVVTAGNQAQIGVANIAMELLEDTRVTALGLHIEGFGDLHAFEALAARAAELGKRIIALKVGKSHQARAASVSHTASLAGEDAGAEAFLSRLSIARLDDLPSFLETLKLLHVASALASNRIATLSCSGGEASLAADSALDRNLVLPDLNTQQRADLAAALGPKVALANPLDYHTYIWRDVPAMTQAFAAMMDPDLAMTLVIVDFPRGDMCDPTDWDCVIEAARAAKKRTGGQIGLVSTIPELMPETLAKRLMSDGIVGFCGLNEALNACEAAAKSLKSPAPTLLLPTVEVIPTLLAESEAKRRLSEYGLQVPKALCAGSEESLRNAIETMELPLVVKAAGVAHKSDLGCVYLARDDLELAYARGISMPCEDWLIEELIEGAIAELLVGVVKDPAHGFVMTLAAGGVLTELLEDRASFLLPASEQMILEALESLRLYKLLSGYRGQQAADVRKILQAIFAVQSYVLDNAEGLEEIEINPLICTAETAIAADALIRRKD